MTTWLEKLLVPDLVEAYLDGGYALNFGYAVSADSISADDSARELVAALDLDGPDGPLAGADTVHTLRFPLLPTDTVYGLGADPREEAAVDRLLTAKGRGRDKPSPVLVASLGQAEGLVERIPDAAAALMRAHWPGALTLVLPARQLGWDLGETNGTVALRMPGHPVALSLLRRTGPLAVSSANLTGRPPATSVAQAREQLGEAVSVYLDGGECRGGAPSTIVGFDGARIRLYREGAVSRSDLSLVGEVAG